MENSKYSKYIVQQLQTPKRWGYERKEGYAKWGKRVLWMDDDVVKGAFQMNCSWYLRPPTEETAEGHAHAHNTNEIIGFFSGDPNNPYELGGLIEFWLEDEKFMIDKSSMIYIPAGMNHCPLIIKRVDRPIFHFSTLTESHYIWSDGKQP
jgi:hypothetical protein